MGPQAKAMEPLNGDKAMETPPLSDVDSESADNNKSSCQKTGFPSFALPQNLKKYYEALSSKTSDNEDLWNIDTDAKYFELIRACENARFVAYEYEKMLACRVFKMDKPSSPPPQCNEKKLLVQLKRFFRSLHKKRLELLAKAKRRPILEAFLDEFNATEKYRQLVHFVVVMESGWMRSSTLRNFNEGSRFSYRGGDPRGMPGMPGSMYNVGGFFPEIFQSTSTDEASFSVDDISTLTKSTGLWAKQKVFSSTPSNSKRTGSFAVTLEGDSLRVFTGLEITVAEFQSLKSSFLQRVLEKDPLFQSSPTGHAIRIQKQNTAKSQPAAKRAKLNPLKVAMERNKSSLPSSRTKNIFEILSTQSNGSLETPKVENKQMEKMEMSMHQDEKGQVPPAIHTTKEKDPGSTSDEKKIVQDAEELYGAYKSDLSYLEDQVRFIEKFKALNKVLTAISSEEDDDRDPLERDCEYERFMGMPRRQRVDPDEMKRKKAKLERELKQLEEKINRKLLRNINGRQPRLEQLCEALELEPFEKYCVLELCKGLIVPPEINRRGSMGGPNTGRRSTVGNLINQFCHTLESRMRSRKYFYKSSALILEGVLTLSHQDFMKDLSDCSVELDRRMFDFIVGLDTEFAELVDGSHLYLPEVEFDDVVLPAEVKDRVWDCVSNFEDVQKTMIQYDVDKKFSYGLGQVLLFYGHSGTGKTMLANAIATKLKKQVLLINFPSLGGNSSGALIKFLFREARINKALLFFDECEGMFRSRGLGGSQVNMLLTEIERFDGICILATNRPNELDEAMHRRISLAIQFNKPDHILREKIWATLQPPKLPIDDGIDLNHVASRYELTGGLIKNAWLQSIILMKKRGGDKVSQDDISQAASEQVRGQLTLDNFDRGIIPSCGIDTLVLSDSLRSSLMDVTQHSKAQSVLMGQWGFNKIHRATTGISALFTGKPGTGKTMAAEAIGFELGRPLMVINIAELMSKWVGETGKNIQSVFDIAKKKDAVLVFDEAESLFGKRSMDSSSSCSRHDTLNVGLLLHHIETFGGVCIVISNLKSAIDEAFFRRFRFVMDFEPPGLPQRKLLWEKMIPKACPLAKDVSLETLAQRYELSGGDIRSALLRAATRAALRGDYRRKIFMEDLIESCDEEVKKRGLNAHGSASMYT